jgi:hypothetical protein
VSLLSRRFAGFMGLDDYEPGTVVTIRGKQYIFPSYTDLYHASKASGALKEYQVKDASRIQAS